MSRAATTPQEQIDINSFIQAGTKANPQIIRDLLKNENPAIKELLKKVGSKENPELALFYYEALLPLLESEFDKTTIATELNDLALMRKIITDDQDVFAFYSTDEEDKQRTLLDIIRNGNTELFQFLLDHLIRHPKIDFGFYLNNDLWEISGDDGHGTLLHAAIRYDQPEIVDILLKTEGINFEKPSQDVGSPLEWACERHASITIIEKLIQAGARIGINYKYEHDDEAPFALAAAAKHGHVAAVKFMLDSRSAENPVHESQLREAICLALEKQEEWLEDLNYDLGDTEKTEFDKKIQPLKDGLALLQSALPKTTWICDPREAMKQDNAAIIQQYLSQDFSPEELEKETRQIRGESARKGKIKILASLLPKPADCPPGLAKQVLLEAVTYKGIRYLPERKNCKALQFLIPQYIPLDANRDLLDALFQLAIIYDHPEILSFMLDQCGYTIQTPVAGNVLPVHYAICKGSPQVIKLLCSRDAALDTPTTSAILEVKNPFEMVVHHRKTSFPVNEEFHKMDLLFSPPERQYPGERKDRRLDMETRATEEIITDPVRDTFEALLSVGADLQEAYKISLSIDKLTRIPVPENQFRRGDTRLLEALLPHFPRQYLNFEVSYQSASDSEFKTAHRHRTAIYQHNLMELFVQLKAIARSTGNKALEQLAQIRAKRSCSDFNQHPVDYKYFSNTIQSLGTDDQGLSILFHAVNAGLPFMAIYTILKYGGSRSQVLHEADLSDDLPLEQKQEYLSNEQTATVLGSFHQAGKITPLFRAIQMRNIPIIRCLMLGLVWEYRETINYYRDDRYQVASKLLKITNPPEMNQPRESENTATATSEDAAVQLSEDEESMLTQGKLGELTSLFKRVQKHFGADVVPYKQALP